MSVILITGSRKWTNRVAIQVALQWAARTYGDPVTVRHGACPYGGADKLAASIAREHGWAVDAHPADWRIYGKAAGPKRNQEMVDLGADVCLAFPMNDSRGTWDCVRRARAAGIRIHVFEDGVV